MITLNLPKIMSVTWLYGSRGLVTWVSCVSPQLLLTINIVAMKRIKVCNHKSCRVSMYKESVFIV